MATATATALVVDLIRLPVYLATRWSDVAGAVVPALLGVAGVVGGMFLGRRIFGRVPEDKFGRVVSGVLLLIGTLMLVRLFHHR